MSEVNKVQIGLSGISLAVLILGLFMPFIGSSVAYCAECDQYDMSIHDIANEDEIGRYGPFEDSMPRIWLLLGLLFAIAAFAMSTSSNLEDYRKLGSISSIVSGVFALLAFFAVLSVFNDVNDYGRDGGAPYDVAEMMWVAWATIGAGVFAIISGFIGLSKGNE
ncbi:MAG: hypothetical protein ACXAD7_20815 [Candidatus Kariarchaeaceae archaeon]|jgi:hypothetical protein